MQCNDWINKSIPQIEPSKSMINFGGQERGVVVSGESRKMVLSRT